jgi:hypothetical protein
MPNDDPDNSDITDALISKLLSNDVDGLSLHALMGDKEVKAALIAELRDLSIPAPGVVYRLIVLALGGCERFLGGSIRSRLQAYVDHTPALAKVLQKFVNLRHGARAQDDLKTSLLASLKVGTPLPDDIRADEASSLEMVIALHTAKGLADLDVAIAALGDDLINDFRNELECQLNQLVAPNLSWLDSIGDTERLSAFDRLKYTSGLDTFVGRDDEIDLLHRFAGDPSFGGKIFNFQWMLMTGAGGEGKTRLAYEFTRERLSANWDKGKLDLDSLNAFGNPAQWRPTRPTFMVIDYAQTAPKKIHKLLAAHSEQAARYEFPVRLLLLERSADESWTDKMLPETSSKPVILQHNFDKRGVQGTGIGALMPEAIVSLMKRRIETAKVEMPDDMDLLKLASNVDPRKMDGAAHQDPILIPRPLFALAATDAIIHALKKRGALPTHLDQDEVLSGIIKRDRDTIWRPIIKNDGDLRRYEMGFAIATFAQGIDLQDLNAETFGCASNWLPPTPPDHNDAALAAFGSRDGYWPQMEPDILGEFFLSEQLLNSTLTLQQRNALIAGAMALNEAQPAITLLRMARDFPERLEALNLAASATTAGEVAVLNFAALVVGLSGNKLALKSANTIFDAICACDDWKRTSRIALEVAKAAVNISSAAGGAGDWPRVDDMLTRLDTLRNDFPGDQEIALEVAKAAFNISRAAGGAGDWPRVDDMLARLDTLIDNFGDFSIGELGEETISLKRIRNLVADFEITNRPL